MNDEEKTDLLDPEVHVRRPVDADGLHTEPHAPIRIRSASTRKRKRQG